MGKIEGTYTLDKSENFVELLVKAGIPEAQAKLANNGKATLKVKVDGKKIFWTYEGINTFESTLIDGEEVEEKMAFGEELLTLMKVEGDVLKLSSKYKKGNTKMQRIYTFTDAGLNTEIIMDSGIKATRYYKRV